MMLNCGLRWKPVRIERVIEGLESSTKPSKVSTDAGIGFIKGMGNPMGTTSLATELVGAELACWFGLRTPDFAIINVADIDIPMLGVGNMQNGPAFISRELKAAAIEGMFLLPKVKNKNDISKLVVFDTWIMNPDRYHPDGHYPNSNFDNVLFVPVGRGIEMIVFDHSSCFIEGTLETSIFDDFLLEDDRVYGLFPEFTHYITDAAVLSAVAKLRQIDRATATEIVGSIPQAWGISEAVRQRWTDVICLRASKVAEYIGHKLLNQPVLQLDLQLEK